MNNPKSPRTFMSRRERLFPMFKTTELAAVEPVIAPAPVEKPKPAGPTWRLVDREWSLLPDGCRAVKSTWACSGCANEATTLAAYKVATPPPACGCWPV